MSWSLVTIKMGRDITRSTQELVGCNEVQRGTRQGEVRGRDKGV